jgi:hypothetical protein
VATSWWLVEEPAGAKIILDFEVDCMFTYPVFDPVAKASSPASQDDILYRKRADLLARGC